uniref:Ig-like domain-containing protein n=1 Tax=Xenopus tropicalis TaxID=8364 RepID=A0A7D9N0F9_XENTR
MQLISVLIPFKVYIRVNHQSSQTGGGPHRWGARATSWTALLLNSHSYSTSGHVGQPCPLLPSVPLYSHRENLANYNNCSERVRQENTSLRIENTTVTDQGTYTCELVTYLGTFFTSVLLEVLVQPSVTLELNKLGVPECRAHGGNPAANISWIPEGSISTNRAMEPDRSWTVSSTYTATSSNVTQVTCIVSHPTFPQLHSTAISTAGSRM